MALSGAARIQSNSALVTATSSFTASLPNPTQDSSTLLLFVGTAGSGVVTLQSSSSFDPPWFFDQGQASQLYVYRRDNQPAGETSWAVPTVAVSNPYYWRIEEWGGLSTIGQPDATGMSIVTGASTASSATDASITCTADVDDFAALAVFQVRQGAAGAFAAGHSYGAGASAGPSSWNEVAWLVNGDGTHTSDFATAIAEAYPGASGDVAASLNLDTSGGGVLPGQVDAACVLYQAAAAPPALGILAA